MNQEEIDKWYRHEILQNRTIYPALFELEVKKNNYRIFGTIFDNHKFQVKL